MKDILALAQSNSLNLNDSYQKIKSNILDEFTIFLEKNKEFSATVLKGLSTKGEVDFTKLNTKPSFSMILDSGEYKSEWEVNEIDPKNHFGKYADQRETFDLTFAKGKEFKYLALIAGTEGVPFWGDYTLVFDPSKIDQDQFIALKFNSLIKTKDGKSHYYFTKSEVDIVKLSEDLSDSSNLENLVCIKLSGKIEESNNDKFKEVLLQNLRDDHRDYVEIITWKKLHLKECLKAIRTSKSYYRIINKAIQKAYAAKSYDPLGESYKNLLELNNLLNSYLDHGVELDIIKD